MNSSVPLRFCLAIIALSVSAVAAQSSADLDVGDPTRWEPVGVSGDAFVALDLWTIHADGTERRVQARHLATDEHRIASAERGSVFGYAVDCAQPAPRATPDAGAEPLDAGAAQALGRIACDRIPHIDARPVDAGPPPPSAEPLRPLDAPGLHIALPTAVWKGVVGRVELDTGVAADGSTFDRHLVRSPDIRLTAAVEQALLRVRFQPERRGGQPVPARRRVRLDIAPPPGSAQSDAHTPRRNGGVLLLGAPGVRVFTASFATARRIEGTELKVAQTTWWWTQTRGLGTAWSSAAVRTLAFDCERRHILDLGTVWRRSHNSAIHVASASPEAAPRLVWTPGSPEARLGEIVCRGEVYDLGATGRPESPRPPSLSEAVVHRGGAIVETPDHSARGPGIQEPLRVRPVRFGPNTDEQAIVVSFVVETDGSVTDIATEGDVVAIAAVLGALNGARYVPALADGLPVRSRQRLVIQVPAR